MRDSQIRKMVSLRSTEFRKFHEIPRKDYDFEIVATEEDVEKIICKIEHEDIKSGLINRTTGRNIFRFLLISKELQNDLTIFSDFYNFSQVFSRFWLCLTISDTSSDLILR